MFGEYSPINGIICQTYATYYRTGLLTNYIDVPKENILATGYVHLAFSFDKTNIMNLYINGVLVGTKTAASNRTSNPIVVGRGYNAATTYFKGNIRLFKVHDTALT